MHRVMSRDMTNQHIKQHLSKMPGPLIMEQTASFFPSYKLPAITLVMNQIPQLGFVVGLVKVRLSFAVCFRDLMKPFGASPMKLPKDGRTSFKLAPQHPNIPDTRRRSHTKVQN